jgi:hypothetical protein
MSDYTTGDTADTGYDGGASYGDYQTGEQHESLDQLHQVNASENDYNNQFNVYEQDHAAAESTSFDQGSHVEYTNPNGATYEASNYTSYDHAAAETDHVFAAEGSESSHQAEYSELDALQARMDSVFASATEINTGSTAELGTATN